MAGYRAGLQHSRVLLSGYQTVRAFTAGLSRIAVFNFRREIRRVHIPILPRQHWPSIRGKKLLASPSSPLESASRGDPFRRFVRSLSLRPSWLLAPCADPTKMVRCPSRPPRAFTSGLPVPKELPDMTTAPHGNLRRRDFHPQVQQLASLRSLRGVLGAEFPRFHGTIKALRLPDALRAALRCLRLAVPRLHSCFVPAAAECRRVGPGVVHPVPPAGIHHGGDRISYVPGEPPMCLCPALRPRWDRLHQASGMLRRGPRSDHNEGSHDASFGAQSHSFSTGCLRFAATGCPAATQDSLPAAGQALPDGLSPAGFHRKVSRCILHLILLSQAFVAQGQAPLDDSLLPPSALIV